MYSEPSETSKMELSIKIVDSIQRLTIFAKHFIVGAFQGYQYVFDKAKQNPGALSLIPIFLIIYNLCKFLPLLNLALSSHYLAMRNY